MFYSKYQILANYIVILAIFDYCIIISYMYIMSKRDVLLAEHNFSKLKRLAINAKSSSWLWKKHCLSFV